MTAAADYRALLQELLRRRWAEGPLGEDVESEYAGRQEDLWDAMTPDERETHEQWLKQNRIHAVVFADGGTDCWTARCLAYDLLGSGPTKLAAIDDLRNVVEQYAHLFRSKTVVHLHPPPASVVDWAVGRLIARLMLQGTKGDELLLIVPECAPTETWTLYVLDLD